MGAFIHHSRVTLTIEQRRESNLQRARIIVCTRRMYSLLVSRLALVVKSHYASLAEDNVK